MATAETRENLLDAAERLFAERGIEGASIREITTSAGANLASINYHFGDKAGLLREVVLRRSRRIVEGRTQMLQLVVEAAGKHPPTVRGIVDAFLSPAVQMAKDNPNFARLIARAHYEGWFHIIGKTFEQAFHKSMDEFVNQLHRALPKLPTEELRWRMMFTVGSFAFVSMNPEIICTMTKGADKQPDPEGLARRLVDFCSAGMQGAATKGARR
jgi:AcrR family transcriptional regulator